MIRKLVVVLIGLILLGCSDSISPKLGKIIYSNSFDKESNFGGWEGISSAAWNTDVPYKQSKYSITISGGCVVPHASYTLTNHINGGYYTIECWGKAYPSTYGGGVSLKYDIDEDHHNASVGISFRDSVWVHKVSDTLFFDNSSELRIEMVSGGFIPSGMFIDDLVVKKVR